MPRLQAATGSEGFTLIELVLILVIVGIISAYAIPRWKPADTTVAAQADRLARDLRHAQSMAMTRGSILTFDIQAPSGYRVADSGTTVDDPADQQAFQITLDNGVTLSGTDTDFDSMGRPVSGGALLTAPRVITLNGSSRTSTVSVSPVTGFVSVSP